MHTHTHNHFLPLLTQADFFICLVSCLHLYSQITMGSGMSPSLDEKALPAPLLSRSSQAKMFQYISGGRFPHILNAPGLPDADYTQVFGVLRLPPLVVGGSDTLLLCKATHFGSFQLPFRMMQTKQNTPPTPALNFARCLNTSMNSHLLPSAVVAQHESSGDCNQTSAAKAERQDEVTSLL